MRTIEEMRQIIEEVLRREESVAMITRRHEVNANLVFSTPDRRRTSMRRLWSGGAAGLARFVSHQFEF
jgi:transposase-like protein